MMERTPDAVPLETLSRAATRRSFTFLLIPVLVLFIFTALMESDQRTHSLDDEIIVAVVLATLIYLGITRKANSSVELARINHIAVIAAAIIAAAGVLAVVLEFSDPTDIGDDPLTIVGAIIAVVNGLLLLSAKGPRAPEQMGSYSVEWSRIRTTFWFSTFWIFAFGSGLIPPYASFNLPGILTWVELAFVLIVALSGLLFVSRSRTEQDPTTLRKYNNEYLVLVVVLGALAGVNFDLATLAYAVVLVANRFL
jgi:hypothetical protein